MDNLKHRIGNYVDMDTALFDSISDLAHKIEDRAAGDQIVKVGETVDYVFVIESGWAARSLTVDDGRRQILNFMLPGDCFDLMSLTRAKSDHNIFAATDVQLRKFSAQEFLQAISSKSQLTTAFWWVAIQEEAILREQIVRIGRRSAKERVGHLILELNRRLQMLGASPEEYVKLPIPQAMLADALGLSIVHISRTMSQLRADGLISTGSNGIEIKDRKGLENMSDFNQGYLHPEKLKLSA